MTSRTPWSNDGLTIRCDKEIIAYANQSAHWSIAYANACLIAEAPVLHALVCALSEELARKIHGTPIEEGEKALKMIGEAMAATARAAGYTHDEK